MKNKIFSLSVLVFSLFLFSACTLNKKQNNSNTVPVATEINQETGNDTEDELLKQLNTDTDSSFDSDLNSLETELGK